MSALTGGRDIGRPSRRADQVATSGADEGHPAVARAGAPARSVHGQWMRPAAGRWRRRPSRPPPALRHSTTRRSGGCRCWPAIGTRASARHKGTSCAGGGAPVMELVSRWPGRPGGGLGRHERRGPVGGQPGAGGLDRDLVLPDGRTSRRAPLPGSSRPARRGHGQPAGDAAPEVWTGCPPPVPRTRAPPRVEGAGPGMPAGPERLLARAGQAAG